MLITSFYAFVQLWFKAFAFFIHTYFSCINLPPSWHFLPTIIWSKMPN